MPVFPVVLMTFKKNALGYKLVHLHWAVISVPESDMQIKQTQGFTNSNNWQPPIEHLSRPKPRKFKSKI